MIRMETLWKKKHSWLFLWFGFIHFISFISLFRKKNLRHAFIYREYFVLRQNCDFKDFERKCQNYWTTQRGRDSEKSSGPKFVFSAFVILGGFFGICGFSIFSAAKLDCVGSRDFGRPTLRKKKKKFLVVSSTLKKFCSYVRSTFVWLQIFLLVDLFDFKIMSRLLDWTNFFLNLSNGRTNVHSYSFVQHYLGLNYRHHQQLPQLL